VETQLGLSADELLSTTRAVRKRLDFDREVQRETVEECLGLALQAPTGGNAQTWAWVLVRDPEIKRQIGDHYRSFFAVYRENLENTHAEGDPHSIHWERMVESGSYLAYERVNQAGLLPVAYTKGSDFRPAPRLELSSVAHLDRWSSPFR